MAKFRQPIDERTAALVLGFLCALVHLVWAVVQFLGYQGLLAWGYALHGIALQMTFLPFDITSALMLVVLSFVGGFVFGYVSAFVWNWVVRRF